MIVFFGPAGSGKSTQGQLLADKMGWSWISSGNLLRESQDAEIKELLAAGHLVPLEKFSTLFAQAIKNSDKSHVILDGFPRKLEQVQWLKTHKDDLGREIQLAVVIDIPRDELIKRMLERGRADDTEDAIEKRLEIYHQEIDPILDKLVQENVPLIHVDGVGAMEEVHQRVLTEVSAHHLE